VVHYLARHGESRVAKAAIISAVRLDGEDGGQSTGQPKDAFDGLQAQLAPTERSSITMWPAGPFTVTIDRVRNLLRG